MVDGCTAREAIDIAAFLIILRSVLYQFQSFLELAFYEISIAEDFPEVLLRIVIELNI